LYDSKLTQSISKQKDTYSQYCRLAQHKITQMTKVGLGHGMVRSQQNQVSLFNKRCYIEKKLLILM